MPDPLKSQSEPFDRTNAALAGLVFLISFVVYALTVQKTFSFWDCGEFIACANILGIPHPPGTPLFVILGRVFAIIPFVEDISHRVNYISVISSAFTAMFAYLLTTKIISHFFHKEDPHPLHKFIGYVGGVAGGLFVAWSRTNWANSVEAEVYGLALALSVALVWLAIKFWENKGTLKANRWMILCFYLATLGIGVHMTVFLVVPVCAIFFILRKDATPRDYLLICAFAIVELLMIILFADGRGGHKFFYFATALLGAGLLALLYKRIQWAVVVAFVSIASVMMSFSTYEKMLFVSAIILVGMAIASKRLNLELKWKLGLTILLIGFVGISVHFFIPIRSGQNPRIDENNPSRDWRTFKNFLDRRQYGQQSMVERMFVRRGAWENQLGRHPHMGFWSYFEEQWSKPGVTFIIPFFLLGLVGMVTAIYKRLEIGMPFFTLFLLTSLGLTLYMNFADGTHYNFQTGDAYMEVRNRDYFFTPAFVFFGIAMGVGIAAIMNYIREKLSNNEGLQKTLVYASAVLVLMPGISLAHSYHTNDRSDNFIPYLYAKNLLDTCEENAILFTSGDNDTFPLWAMQEVYNYRRDVRVVNLSLLNTDWYVEQMKNRYDVPIKLRDDQIVWHPVEIRPGVEVGEPLETFNSPIYGAAMKLRPTPRGDGGMLRVQDIMVDHIVFWSTSKVNDSFVLSQPIYFSSPPYAESPLSLNKRTDATGMLQKLNYYPTPRQVDGDKGYELFMNQYEYDGYQSSNIYRDENATGVFVAVGVNAGRAAEELLVTGQRQKSLDIFHKMVEVYPEHFQSFLMLGDIYDANGDSAIADSLWNLAHDTLTSFVASNPENLYYKQDLAMIKNQLGRRNSDLDMTAEALALSWQAFEGNANSSFAFRKLVSIIYASGLDQAEALRQIKLAADMHWEYGVNRSDPYLRQIRNMGNPPPPPGG